MTICFGLARAILIFEFSLYIGREMNRPFHPRRVVLIPYRSGPSDSAYPCAKQNRQAVSCHTRPQKLGNTTVQSGTSCVLPLN